MRAGSGNRPGALQFDPDLSVHWREHIELHSLGLSHLVRFKAGAPLVFQAIVGEVRGLRSDDGRQMYVAYTPTNEPTFGCSHASVLLLVRDRDKQARDELREDLRPLWRLVYGTPTLALPEGA